MKTMTCRQLGGACDEAFRAGSLEEIAELSKRHGQEMFQQGDPAHRQANEIVAWMDWLDELKELLAERNR